MSALYSGQAMAAGTLAGTPITNSVSVSYKVGGALQDEETASNSFRVDRKVDLMVARTDDAATQVAPGSVSQAVEFQVTNTSNDTLDFDLSAAQVASGQSAGISGNDSFDVGALTFYLDANGNGVVDGGESVITHLDALAPDTSAKVLVVAATVPTGLSTNAIASVVLTATAHENDGGVTLGGALSDANSNDADPDHVDTIFADGSSGITGDIARDASYSAKDDYKVFAAAITATKTSKIVAGDFSTGAAIPGATIEYCIAVSNAAGGADASNLAITDTLPAEVTYNAAFGVKVGGADCNTPGGGSGSESGGVVTGSIASLTAGSTQTVIFRADIN
jgi:uncharacterized repeat protein (TIGR01451 family)